VKVPHIVLKPQFHCFTQ